MIDDDDCLSGDEGYTSGSDVLIGGGRMVVEFLRLRGASRMGGAIFGQEIESCVGELIWGRL